jgi:hypothetical protein
MVGSSSVFIAPADPTHAAPETSAALLIELL